jgi:hypothetical protein
MFLSNLENDIVVDDPASLSELMSLVSEDASDDTPERGLYPFIVPLGPLLDWFPVERAESLLATFASDADDDERFLKTYAIGLEEESIAYTFLFLDPCGHGTVCGYITLGNSHLFVSDRSCSEHRGLCPVPCDRPVPTFAIWRICRGRSCPIPFEDLLQAAKTILRSRSRLTGCRLVRTDCRPSESSAYEDAGFRPVGPVTGEGLEHMLLFL